MQSIVCIERPDCCDVIAIRDKWIISFEDITDSEEYNDVINHLKNNRFNEQSLVKYAKYHLKLI